MDTLYDVVIVGGGPAGLSAALALGRARRRVLLCDAGSRRNAAAEHMQNFVTRDGTPPEEFRRIGRQQLAPYRNVDVVDAGVEAIGGERGAFAVRLSTGEVRARRVLLCTGMIDQLPDIDGFRALWGTSIIICPYCHGWEVQDRRFAFLATAPEMVEHALLFRAWTRDLVVLTDGGFSIAAEVRAKLASAGVGVDERRIARVTGSGGQLEQIAFAEGAPLAVDVLFARPPQRQVALVEALGVALDDLGYVKLDDRRQTSIAGVFAGGDLVGPMQAAILAAASGMQAAAMLNHDLVPELATRGALP